MPWDCLEMEDIERRPPGVWQVWQALPLWTKNLSVPPGYGVRRRLCVNPSAYVKHPPLTRPMNDSKTKFASNWVKMLSQLSGLRDKPLRWKTPLPRPCHDTEH